jgi:2-iminobutanoate/2-iminopropanoate deaminase
LNFSFTFLFCLEIDMPRTTLRPKSLDFQPRPTYPYSPGAHGGGMIFTAGQVAWDETGEVAGIGDVAAQTRQTLKNVVAVLHEGGATVDDVIKCNVYLADIRDFDVMNAEFATVFPTDPPARTTVEARLAEATMLVEIEAVAWVAPKT